MTPVLTLYGRSGCHLCDEALEAIVRLRRSGVAFDLEQVDIDDDDRLLSAYLERIPVVAVDGEVVSELRLDLSVLRSRLGTVGT